MLKKILIGLISILVLGVLIYLSITIKFIKFNVVDENKTKISIKFKRRYLKEPNIKLKNGYTIEGWYLDKDFNEKWIFDANKVYKNSTLYAKVLKSINASIYRGDVLISEEMFLDYTQYKPMMLGYTFKGLYLDKDFNEKLDYPLDNHNEHLVLYEKWEIEKRTLPIMTIDIFEKEISDIDKIDYSDVKISLFNLDDEFVLNNLDAGFRGRGNSSWESFDKKGYKIKFDKKQSLFGKAKNKHYALVAEAFDITQSKNLVAYTLGAEVFSNIEYTPDAHLIDLYVNGEYYGVYLLLEHRRVGEGRVDIDSNFGEIDTGYLLEYDSRANSEDNVLGVDYFYIDGLKHPFLVKSPDPDDYQEKGEITQGEFKAQVFYIQDYLQSAVDAIFSGNKEDIEELIDLPSLIDMYILQEFLKNYDSGWSSQYVYKKKGGKLYFGPPWDFDITAGSNFVPGLKSPEGFYVGSKLSLQPPSHRNQLYISLMTNDWFIELVKERVIELEPTIRTTVKDIYKDIYSYDDSFYLNFLRWPNITKANIDPQYYFEEQQKTEQWYYDRLDWFLEWANN